MAAVDSQGGGEPHVDAENLALLVEGREGSGGVREHLVRCPECFHAYSEAVQARSEWLRDGAESPEAVAGLAGLGRELGPAGHGPMPAFRGGGRSLVLRAGLSVAAAVAVILAALWLRPGAGPEPEAVLQFDPLVQAEVLAYSADAFVLPGGEAGADAVTAQSRGAGDAGASPKAAAAWQTYLSGSDRPGPGIEAVAGYLALGKIQLARDCLVRLAADHPSDPRVFLLQAVSDYQLGDSPGAERALRRALELDPGHGPAALDLGLLLKWQDRTAEARPLLESVMRNRAGTPLARRAERELGTP